MKTRRNLHIAFSALPFVFLLIIIGLFISSNPVYSNRLTRLQHITNGTVKFDRDNTGISQLQGLWLFLWGRTVFDFNEMDNQTFAPLPGSWKQAGIDSGFGFASYGLLLTGLQPDEQYALRIGHTISACRILVNGRMSETIGSPGENMKEEHPAWDSVLAHFYPDEEGTARILLHISNFRDRVGGSNASIYVGPAALMSRMEDAQKKTETFVFAVLATMGLFFFALWFFRLQEMSFFWFAWMCITVGFRTLCYDGFVLLDLVPSIPWEVFFRLGYLTFPFIMISFIGFLWTLYPDLVHLYRLLLVAIINSAFILIILFASTFAAATLLPLFQFAGILSVAYGVRVMIVAGVQKRENAYWLLLGFSFAVVSFIYDMMVSMWIISGYSLGHIGMSVCLFCLAIMVIVRYSSSFRKARELSSELRSTNRALSRFVPAEFIDFLEKDSIIDVYAGDCIEDNMAILAADIRSFTAMSEKMQPDEIFYLLNEYYALVAPVVRTNGGIIAKYEGDGFFALFPGGSEQAIRAAIQIQSVVMARNRTLPAKRPFQVGIGIDAGDMMLGIVGDTNRIDTTIISDCIRCAGVLQSATRLYQSKILINETVYASLAGPQSFFVRPVDRVDVGNRMAFLFEVYNNDSEDMRELKVKTQSDFEHAIFSWFSGQTEESRQYLQKVLALFPDDPVAQYYIKRL